MVGLCAHCVYHRAIETKRGSVFHLCELSERDARYPKYPRLPVPHCAGYVPEGTPGSQQR